MSKVYIVQEPNRIQKENGKVIRVDPVYNYESARVYGDLVYCMRHGNARFNPEQTVKELRYMLRDFTVDDYILPTGDPGIIGVAIAIAAKHTKGKFKVLRWMRHEQSYLEMEYDINV